MTSFQFSKTMTTLHLKQNSMQEIDMDRLRKQLFKPAADSHKGENGRLLVIGGSKLFHASIFWSADMASKIVDLVHFMSPAEENNELVRQKMKAGFWKGIVAPYTQVDEYIEEDDVVLIGPGMPRDEGLFEGEVSTSEIVNGLVSKHGNKKWVIDGGALQEIDPKLLTGKMIITPHHKEWDRLLERSTGVWESGEEVRQFSQNHDKVTILLKGKVDVVGRGNDWTSVSGGNSGMTKGGTGDVLAGLVAALYCTNDALISSYVASVVMKRAGEKLAEVVGPYYNAGDLVEVIPEILARI